MVEPSLQGIKSLFEPRSIIVVGVSTDESKLSSIIYSNLLRNRKLGILKASVYPLNPSHSLIRGRACYPDFASLPEVPELVVVAIPAALAVEAVKDSARAGAKAVILITGGFAESGQNELEQEMLAAAKAEGMRLLGPNTVGLLDTFSGVDSLFLRPTKRLSTGKEVVSIMKPPKGDVAVITQSGHLGEVVSEELGANGVGLRALVGTGNQLDVSVEDIIAYFAEDARCGVIAVYLEGVHDGRRFIRIAAKAAKRKPVVVFKMGKTQAGALAAMTHTASIVGDYDVYKAAFKAAGVIEAKSLQELLDYCVTFSMLKQRPGRRLLISTNAGGVGAIAADEAGLDGLEVPPLSRATASAVRRTLGVTHSSTSLILGNPMDLTATVATEPFVRATAAAIAAPYYDMAVVLPTHQTPTISPEIARELADCLLRIGKPASVCVMGKSELADMIQEAFLGKGIPSFPTPERAVRSMAALSEYAILRRNTKSLGLRSFRTHDASIATSEGLVWWQSIENLMSDYRIPQPKSVFLSSHMDYTKAARLKYPLACKLVSPNLVHKTDVGGVILNVRSVEELESATRRLRNLAGHLGIGSYGVLIQEMAMEGVELLLGATRDRVFGPTITLGAGGRNVELLREFAVAIAPLNERAALAFVSVNPGGRALAGYRGGPNKVSELARIVSRFSRILSENPHLEQIEINPLIVSEKGLSAVDVRAVAGTS